MQVGMEAMALVLVVPAIWAGRAAHRALLARPPQPRGYAGGSPESAFRLRDRIQRAGRIPLGPPGATQLPLALRPGEAVVFRTACRTWGRRLRLLPETGELVVTNRRLLYFGRRTRITGFRLGEARLLDWSLSELVVAGPSSRQRPLRFFTADAPVVRELLLGLRFGDWVPVDDELVLQR